jgi:hypothetical protein
MKRALLLIFLCCIVRAQDELYFRDLYSGNFLERKKHDEKKYKWKANSSFYQLDLGGGKWPESLVMEKRDGEDWLHIHDENKKRFFSFQFDINGKGARVYRVLKHHLSPRYKVLIIYYYEGNTHYYQFSGSIRLYFLTVDDSKLETISIFKGPIIWEERRGRKENYFQKRYVMELIDFNGDGVREIKIKGKFTKFIFFYKGGGKWKEL